jgi:SagB-type dehydrogenase family enzyme
MSEHIGDEFQKETKHRRENMRGRMLDWSKKPPGAKVYPNAEFVDLGLWKDVPEATLWETLRRRRSVRDYSDEPMTRRELSLLLYAAQGVTAKEEGYLFRAAPSAGALYPIETCVVVNNVREIKRGVWHYNVADHRIELIEEGDFRPAVARAALDQGMCADAAAVFVWTAVFDRSKWKYDQRAYRYVYLDAGHIAGNVALAAVALRLGSCQIAALYDDEVNALVGADGTKESAVYMTSVGRPRR